MLNNTDIVDGKLANIAYNSVLHKLKGHLNMCKFIQR